MERPQLSKSERKNMDTCLRRLKQELVSMKEAGDGLHAQMNSMMGALQELKLLQVQTALDQLDISGRCGPPPQPSSPAVAEMTCDPSTDHQTPEAQLSLPRPGASEEQNQGWSRTSEEQHQYQRLSWAQQQPSSLGTSPSSSSLDSESLPLPHPDPDPLPLPRRVSGYTAPQADFCGPRLSLLLTETRPAQPMVAARPVDLPGILSSLAREGPSLDSDYSQDSAGDSADWTSSLMSRSRNRQPLVLGDNVFADLVGNWLDLPELEREDEEEDEEKEEKRAELRELDRPDSPAHPLRRLSRSQEICRKFSLTTNIFKKFLRSVRPDRDKLLKERPGWMAPEQQADAELFKRPRKAPASGKGKGSFYRPFWAAGAGQQGKGRPCLQPGGPPQDEPCRTPFLGVYIDRRDTEGVGERTQPLFDYNTAVWV